MYIHETLKTALHNSLVLWPFPWRLRYLHKLWNHCNLEEGWPETSHGVVIWGPGSGIMYMYILTHSATPPSTSGSAVHVIIHVCNIKKRPVNEAMLSYNNYVVHVGFTC